MRKTGGQERGERFFRALFCQGVARDAAHLSYLYIIHYALYREPKKEYID